MAKISASQVANRIKAAGIVAIFRGDFPVRRLPVIVEALADGGVSVVEITLNSRNALEAIETSRNQAPDEMLIGAGTVRTAKEVDRASAAGAQFLVSPNLDPESIARSQAAGLLHLPGVFTATEAQAALDLGCRMMKLFPADSLGPQYIKALRSPLDDIDFVPTGGINAKNIAGYLQAGAVAVGVGSSLVSGPDEDPAELTQRAANLVAALQRARENEGD